MSTENTKTTKNLDTKATIKQLLNERPIASIVAAAIAAEAQEAGAKKILEVRNVLRNFDIEIKNRVEGLRSARAIAKSYEKDLSAAITAKAQYEETGDIKYYQQL